MLISKFDLYNPEWLELVFDKRNKEYGAYELRQHYAGNMIKAMGIAFLGIGLLFGAGMVFKNAPVTAPLPPPQPPIVVTLHPPDVPVTPPKKPVEPPRPTEPIKMTANPPPLVTPDPLVKIPPTPNDQLKGAIGPVTTEGKDKGSNVLPDDKQGKGQAVQPVVDASVHPLNEVQIMPEPVGGDKAWNKFLNKNLRFPAPAQEEGASGRVLLSFIIEKDGSLSDINVIRPAGHGFDEEALRVLKLAKAWKPGIQNGQPVRVRFVIPISFQAAQPE